MNCEICSKHPDPVPFAVHESAMARAERTIKRLWILLILMLVLLVGSNALWIWYESQWEVVETTTEIEQDTSGSGNNYIVGGDFNGEAKDQNDNEIQEP